MAKQRKRWHKLRPDRPRNMQFAIETRGTRTRIDNIDAYRKCSHFSYDTIVTNVTALGAYYALINMTCDDG